jgi:hypothetical protein
MPVWTPPDLDSQKKGGCIEKILVAKLACKGGFIINSKIHIKLLHSFLLQWVVQLSLAVTATYTTNLPCISHFELDFIYSNMRGPTVFDQCNIRIYCPKDCPTDGLVLHMTLH